MGYVRGEVHQVWLCAAHRKGILELDVNTFGRDLELATLDNLDSLFRLVACQGLYILNHLDNRVALEHLAENDVTTIEPAVCTPISQAIYLYIHVFISFLLSVSSLDELDSKKKSEWEKCLRGNNRGDEELGAIGVGTGVSHGKQTFHGVLELEVLILELFAVDCEALQLVNWPRKSINCMHALESCQTYWTCHRCRRPW